MFSTGKVHFFAIWVAIGGLSLLQSSACETPEPKTAQTLRLHKNHMRPFFSLLSSFKNSPAEMWAQNLEQKFNACDVLAAQIRPEASPLQLFELLQCHPTTTIKPHSVATFQWQQFNWDIQISQKQKGPLEGRVQLLPTSKASEASLLLPSTQPANFKFLNEGNALFAFHGNSADGRGLYGLLLDNNQVQDIFGMGSILGGLISDSRWAAALYPPTTEAKVPMLVLAAGLSSDTVKNVLVTQFENALTEQYQLKSRSFSHAGFSGKCFSSIPLFPALAPCIVTGTHSALISWNETALKMATQQEGLRATTQAGMVGRWNWTAIERANKALSEDKVASLKPGIIHIEGNKKQKTYEYRFTWRQGARQ